MVKLLQAIVIALCSTFLVLSLAVYFLILVVKRRRNVAVVDDPIAVVEGQPMTSLDLKENAWLDPSLGISIGDIGLGIGSAGQIVDRTSFATVHKVEIPGPGGRNLTVKRLLPDSCGSFAEFRTELEILRNLRHPNIVRMLGYRLSGNSKVLIYEYFERGSLDACLRRPEALSWEARVKIVRGVAEGLAFMHSRDSPIIHRSVNPKSVLVGPNFEGCIDDFGLARLIEVLRSRSHVSTDPVGPPGYSPPEYFTCRAVTTKGDVYGFGVLMLAAVSWDWDVDEGRRLVKWAQDMKTPEVNIPSSNSAEAVEQAQVKEYFGIALTCVNSNPRNRPTMMEVVDLLKNL